ncbi:MAG: ATP-binding cassette domain-containing protein [Oscillospiraceae bacterium]
MSTLVEMKGVIKKFPGVTALKDISFDIKAGEVHVLLGENGAGKSTLMKILSGVYQPTEGTIIVNGKEFSKLTPKDSTENGISVIYQELSVINELSIQENLFVGKLPMKKIGPIKVVDYAEINRQAIDLMKKVGLKRDPKTLVEDISISEKQQVEIAKALAANSQVLVMDEPTASLTSEEINHLFKIVKQLKDEGKGIVFISHKLGEIIEIGDRVSVLKDGVYVGTKDVKDVTADDLVTMMVGRQIQKTYQNDNAPETFEREEVIFEVKNLSRRDKKVKDVSFKLHKGEILGFSGLVGSGRSEMMNSIFGAEPKMEGQIFIKGKEVKIKSPYNAIKHGLAMVTENRRETGFFQNFDIKQNISILPFIKKSKVMGTSGLVNGKFEKKCAKEQKEKLNIKCSDINQNITELSGGNQQKVILGKWMAAGSEIIIFDEPTKGIDIGSKSEIYSLMRKLANEGKGVLVVSSELPELLAVCDTIAVFREGKVVKTFAHSDATEEKIIMASTADYVS